MGTTNVFVYLLAAILLLPLVPAFLLYKFLPSRTNVSGPFKGLSIKLTGAFGGYFLLVLTAVAVFFPLLKNDQAKIIDQQNEKISQLENALSNHQQWVMKGNVASTSPKQTKVFFDESGTNFWETGEFSMIFNAELQNGKPLLPKALCIFNKDDGYKVLNLSRDFASSDIKAYGVTFNDSLRSIIIDSIIDIQSKAKSRLEAETNLLSKIQAKEIDVKTYNPRAAIKYIPPETIKTLIKTTPPH